MIIPKFYSLKHFRGCLLFFAVLQLCATRVLAQAPNRTPNVIIIIADDLGSGDVSSLFRQVVKTPNIDRFAKMGVKFESGYVPVPLCGPSRAALLTGQYPQRFGFGNNVGGIPAEKALLPGILRKNGYYTGHIGKWHSTGPMPYQRGAFDESLCSPNSSPFINYFHPQLSRNGVIETSNEYSTDLFTREAISFIERNQKKPFELTVAFNAPHILINVSNGAAPLLKQQYDASVAAGHPISVPKVRTSRPEDFNKFIKQFPGDTARADAVAAIYALDQGIGQILDKLKQTGLDKNTVVFFFSDNGAHPENRSENLPLKDYKWTVYEGGIRVPFLVMYPNVFPAGLNYKDPVSTLDIFKTCMGLTGTTGPSDLDGMDLTPYLTGKIKSSPHKQLFFKYGNMGAVREGNWKLVLTGNQKVELFDLSKDVEEDIDLAANQPILVKQMTDEWKVWNAQMVSDSKK